jgi:hypothetical protein
LDYEINGYFQRIDALPHPSEMAAMLTAELPQTLEDYIQDNHCLAIHFRRGDYVTNSGANAFHGVLPLDYYQKALGALEDAYMPFVFSDDPEWCKAHLSPLLAKYDKVVYVDTWTTDPYLQWSFMTQMDGFILANSSYSWLAALCSSYSGMEVIYPDPWFAMSDNPSDHVLAHWRGIKWRT